MLGSLSFYSWTRLPHSISASSADIGPIWKRFFVLSERPVCSSWTQTIANLHLVTRAMISNSQCYYNIWSCRGFRLYWLWHTLIVIVGGDLLVPLSASDYCKLANRKVYQTGWPSILCPSILTALTRPACKYLWDMNRKMNTGSFYGSVGNICNTLCNAVKWI